MRKDIIFIALIFGCFIPFSSHAQTDIEREVRVVKPYTPTLSDAEKINLLPEFNDTTVVRPDFEYSIRPKRFTTDFRVRPITPARMVGLPLKRLYKSQLSLGIGNYRSPFAELTINQLRSRKSTMGLYLKHHSSRGKVRLENDERVDAPYSDNYGEVYGKIIYPRAVLAGNVNGGYQSVVRYGYDPELPFDTLLRKEDNQQKIYSLGTDVRLYSTHADSFHFNYDFGLKYQLAMDAYDNLEHIMGFKSSMSTFLGDFYSGMDLAVNYYDKSESIDSSDNLLVSLNPWFSKSTSNWRFLLGLNSAYDHRGTGSLYIYPRALFEFSIVQNVLIPYMGVNGYREANNYRKILFENPFIKPGLHVGNTNHTINGYLGLKGRYSSKMTFDFRLNYSEIDSMYFFVNDTSGTLKNQFLVDYDNVSLLGGSGEITWNYNKKLQFILKASYKNYEPDQLAYAWHKSAIDASLSTSYNLRDKILVDAMLFYTGKRYAPGPDPEEPFELKPYLDGNLSVEYRYTKLLSFFLHFRNISASRYMLWNQYPVQRFQLMGGFTYAL